MNMRSLRLVGLLAAVWMLPPQGFAACSLGQLAELPVRMVGLRALVPVKLNGVEAELEVESGSFFSLLSPAAAAALKLKLQPTSVILQGVKGSATASVASIDDFVLANVPLKGKWDFLVGGSDPGSGAAGLLGQNILGIADSEYDLSDGVVRLMKPSGCADKPLAYWATGRPLPVEMMSIDYSGRDARQIIGEAQLNGHNIRVLFDSGAATSILTLAAAKRAGVTPQSPGVISAGIGFGLGRGSYPTWVGPFASFKLAGEETRNTRIRFGDLSLANADMLLGMDFFLSHHIYVANSQHKVYFTYNGGPVFNLASLNPASPALQSADPSAQPATSSDYAARGRALIGRRDFAHAIADLTHAVELDATQPDYFYQRALAYVGAKQAEPAFADLEQALRLKPDFVDALLLKARMELANKQASAARADLDAADRALPKESDRRFAMSSLYAGAAAPEQSLHQLDLWIASHDSDARLPMALNERCWLRGMWNQNLEQAEADCKRSLRLASNESNTLDSLGWVELRRGRFEQSVAAFDSALRKAPRLPSSLYGRGLAELRLGQRTAGEADIAAASALAPQIAEQRRPWGISP